MKKLYFFLVILCLEIDLVNSQDIVYNFDTDANDEGWVRAGASNNYSAKADGGNLVVGGTGEDITNFGGAISPIIDIADGKYHIVEIQITNNTSITGFSLMNYETGGQVQGTAGIYNFTVNTGATSTLGLIIPPTPSANNNIIERLGIRIRGNPDPDDSFSINYLKVKESSFEDFLINGGFEDSSLTIGTWGDTNNQSFLTKSIETSDVPANGGNNSAKFEFGGSPQNATIWSDFKITLDESIPDQIQMKVILDQRSSLTASSVRIRPKWRVTKTGESGTVERSLGLLPTVTDEWINVNTSGKLINSSNTSDTYETFELGLVITGAAQNEIIYIDNVTVEGSLNWLGGSNTNWNEGSNWQNGEIPNGGVDVNLFNGKANYPLVQSGNIAVKNLNIGTTASLTLEDDSSLIVNGSSSGNLTYNRNLATTNWYLVSSPVSGEDMTDMRANNSFAGGSIGSNIGLAAYNPGQSGAAAWSYFTSSSTDVLVSGTGYSTKLASTGDISFTGTLNTTDVETPSLSTGFNLIGNPFTSHINSATFLGAATSGNLDQTQIWLWNQGSNGGSGMYEVKTAGESWTLPPGQGFFVKAISDGTVTFAESNQLNTGGTFQKTSKTDLKLLMNDGTNYRFFKIYYRDNASKGFDYGFEGETFGGIPNSLSVFTHLLEDNQGKNYQVQSLPNKDYESMVIPVGVIAAADKELTFTAEAMNLPADLKVFLEDRENGVITRLDEQNNNYKVALNDALNGTGRFYLHTSNSALSADDIALTGVRVFAPNKNTLRVSGINSANGSVKIFSILGKKVLEKSFSSKGVSDINLPNLNTGVYIIQLNTEAGKLNKKIILE